MHLPEEIQTIITKLHDAGYEAYAVGGCVRDVLLKKTPADWDVATSATPVEIQKIFPKSFYANKFGTVTVLSPSPNPGEGGGEVEVTTYRTEANYSDQRHPDSVAFTKNIEKDLARRDFTINAMATDGEKILDPFHGQPDLKGQLIRAVGEPAERFAEDALRLLRAVRFAAQLSFTIEENTLAAIKSHAADIAAVSAERIRDELIKIVMSDQPETGFNLLEQTGLLKEILSELQEGVGIEQNKHHVFTVFDHNIKSLQFAAHYNYPLAIRLSALFHDVGKPRTKKLQGYDYTFYAHDIVGARMTEKLLRRLKFPNEVVDKVTHLIRHHMFYYDIGKVTEAGARRLLKRVGKEHFDDLIKLRIAERKGSGVPKAQPYRLRHLQFLVEKASQAPLTTSELAIDGNDIMKELALAPGPQVGGILNALLAEVIEDPIKNNREYLMKRAEALKDQDPTALKKLGAAAVDEEAKAREEEIRRKYHV